MTPDPVSLTMCLFLHLQGEVIVGQNGVVMLKSVKRTDAGLYTCSAIDFDNMDAELKGDITLTVNCE